MADSSTATAVLADAEPRPNQSQETHLKGAPQNGPREGGQPTTRELLTWLLGITRPVHKPLFVSAVCRIVNICLDIALFAIAAAGVMMVAIEDADLTQLLIVLVVLSLAKAGFYYLEQFTGHYVAFKALELLRTHTFSKLWPKAPAIVSHSRSGDVLTSLTRDVDRIEVVYAHTFAPVVSAYVVGFICVIALWIGPVGDAGWAPFSVALTCLGLALFVVPVIGLRSAFSYTHKTLQQRRGLGQHVTDSIFGSDEVLGYGIEEQRLAVMDQLGIEISESSTRPRDLTGVRRAANLMLMLTAVVSIVWIGSSGSDSSATGDTLLTPVAIAALCAGALRVFELPRGLEDAVGYLDHSLSAARRLWDITHSPARVVDGPMELELDGAPTVSFESVSYAYPGVDGQVLDNAISDISFSVPAGGRAVIIGHSGSGKSTLVQLLLRFDDPKTGQITVDGVPIDRFSLDSLRSRIVLVSQRTQLLDVTLAENLRLGEPDASDGDIWGALEAVGLADEVRAMPEGLDTPVGVGGTALSGGQVQRVGLARALLMKPKVLVLDEFTANLNSALEAEIRASLVGLTDSMTVIEVTHRLGSAQDADVVVTVDSGRATVATRR